MAKGGRGAAARRGYERRRRPIEEETTRVPQGFLVQVARLIGSVIGIMSFIVRCGR